MVSPGLQNYDYFSNETTNEVLNKEMVDDTGDLYADDDEARPTGVIVHRFSNISQFKDLVFLYAVFLNIMPFDLGTRTREKSTK